MPLESGTRFQRFTEAFTPSKIAPIQLLFIALHTISYRSFNKGSSLSSVKFPPAHLMKRVLDIRIVLLNRQDIRDLSISEHVCWNIYVYKASSRDVFVLKKTSN